MRRFVMPFLLAILGLFALSTAAFAPGPPPAAIPDETASKTDMSQAEAAELLPAEASEELEAPVEPPRHLSEPECVDYCLREVGLKFRDCPDCPVMTILPRGSFQMGAAPNEPLSDEDESPQRTVTVTDRLAMGVYEVTFDQWSACVDDGFCRSQSHPHDEDWGKASRPVINISHDDIAGPHGFLDWLNSKVPGRPYRLPSEAEWEYAARAGTTTWFSSGKLVTDAEANFRASVPFVGSNTGEYRRQTLPVGSFGANGFGLHDMMGNVLEWTADCWHPSHAGAPEDTVARAEGSGGDCSKRVLRGGSWLSEPNELRSAYRVRYDAGARLRKVGFRIVKDLDVSIRWAEFTGSYRVKENRPNIADAHYSDVRFSHAQDIVGSQEMLQIAHTNARISELNLHEPVGTFRAASDLEIVAVSAYVENIPLDSLDHHYGDNCLYTTVVSEDGHQLPRPAEVYCTATSQWEGQNYFRELDLRDSIGLWLPAGDSISCPVDISVLLPETISPEAVAETRVTCRIEYREASQDRPVGKFIRIPYLDQYPDGPELIQPDRPWYTSWPDGSPLQIHGASVYLFPKPIRDQFVQDVCVFAIDGDRQHIPGKSFCLPDSIYVSGTNSQVHEIDFQPGSFSLEPGENLSASCRLTKGNKAADCAIFVLVEIPPLFRDRTRLAALYVDDGLVNRDYLENGYCAADIDGYRLTENGRAAISILGRTRQDPWQSTVSGENDVDFAELCTLLFLKSLESSQ